MVFVFVHLIWTLSFGDVTGNTTDGGGAYPSCSSNPNCTCASVVNGHLSADCSGLELSNYPSFSNNVIQINFSWNNFRVFPSCRELPRHLVSLDLSLNEILKFQDDNDTRCFKSLRNLNLNVNNIATNSPIDGLFKGLQKLRYLRIGGNFGTNNQHNDYPENAFTHLISLESLEIDGLDNKGFGEGFRHLSTLSKLNLSGHLGACNIPFLQDTYFRNLKNLQILDISSCNILRIDINTFSHLTNLKLLDISKNTDLTFRVLSNITFDLRSTSIKYMKLNKIHRTFGLSTMLYVEDMKYLKDTAIEVLEMDSNRMARTETEVVTYLPDTLRTLSMCDNLLGLGIYLVMMTNFTGIRVLKASRQFSTHSFYDAFLQQDPRSCDIPRRIPCQTESSMVHSFRHNNANVSPKEFTIPFPPHLRVLDLSDSTLSLSFIPITLDTNVLEVLNLSRNVINFFYGQINNMKHLKTLDLSHNLCSYLNDNSFKGYKSLQNLYLGNNLLGLSDSVFGTKSNISVFIYLRRLEILDLSQNNIKYLHGNVFLGLKRLTSLDISDNGIRKWTFKMRHMKYLNYINLSGNRIRYIQQNVRDWIDEHIKLKNISINLDGNDLQCDCYSLPSLKWMENRKGLFLDFDSYNCRLLNDTSVYLEQLGQIIKHLETTCFSKISLPWLQIGISMAVICPILIAIFGTLYRFRWKLRYLYYLTQYRYNKYDSLLSDDENFEFDAFISYANDDRSFVTTELITHLERDGGCRLCLHERDFEIGKPIAASIANAVNTSRKTIIILSEYFLKSEWCIFEFNMARMESLCSRNGRDVVFVILYGNIKMANVPLQIMELMSANTYKEYTTDEHGKILFWQKVLNAIKC